MLDNTSARTEDLALCGRDAPVGAKPLDRRMKRVRFQEGDWIAIPLRDGGFGVGLLARVPKKSRVLLGYFMGRRYAEVPSMNVLSGWRPEDAVLVAMLGDSGLVSENWPVIGQAENWERARWPMPVFRHVDVISLRWAKRLYSGDGENRFLQEIPCRRVEAEALPEDGLLGSGALRIVLGKA